MKFTGCGVTANMLVLGTSDSGFESRHPDYIKFAKLLVVTLDSVYVTNQIKYSNMSWSILFG